MSNKLLLEVTEEEFSDIQSAIGFTIKEFPKKGARNFMSCLKKLNKRFWKICKEQLIEKSE